MNDGKPHVKQLICEVADGMTTLADVIAMADVIAILVGGSGRCCCHIGRRGGRCYCLCSRCYYHRGHYFNFSSVLLIRTSSQTCDRWYLPMFLLRDGLLTLMNIDSFISLERFCSSLPTILKLFKVTL